MRTIAAISLALLTFVGQLRSQAPQPAFEVASIRKNTSVGARILMDGSGGRYTVTNATLRVLIQNAYEIVDAQLVGGPRWVDTDRFDLNASRGGAPVTQVPAMMRTLLADRFDLKVHHEMRDMPMYTLVMARKDGTPGAALKKADCDDRAGVDAAIVRSRDKVLPCHVHFVGPGRLRAGGIGMHNLAAILTALVGRVVIDKTNLQGAYDFEMEWTADQSRPLAGDAPAPDPAGASLFTALQDQLGVKLTGGRGPVDVLVIDSVSPPTEN